jgi:hypothetical protein
MTTGANSNVRHEGLTYHVQTEDLGTGNPEIVSLVYHEGQILKTIRKGYEDIAGAGVEEIRDRVLTQHRTVIQAILRGRLAPPAEAPQKPVERPSLIVSPLGEPRSGEQTSLMILVRSERSFQPLAGASVQVRFRENGGDPVTIHNGATDYRGFILVEAGIPDTDRTALSLIVEIRSELGEAQAEIPILPGRASWKKPAAKTPEEKLDLIVSDLEDPRAGNTASFMVLTRGKRSCKPVEGARVRLMFAEEPGDPRLLYEGATDAKGYHLVETVLPGTDSSEAAVIIEAESSLGKDEVVIPVLVPRS